jgi:hypothetical protein
MTLVELMIASLLTLVVLGMAYGIFMTTSRTSQTIGSRAINSTSARVAINLLETNLRYATGVLLCGSSGLTTSVCPSPTGNLPNVLMVSNSSVAGFGPTQPACTEWEFLPTGSAQGVGLAKTLSATKAFAVVAPTVLPWPYPATSPGFSLPLARLVEIDFTVNVETTPVAADAVTVRDVISPNNLAGGTFTALVGACP